MAESLLGLAQSLAGGSFGLFPFLSALVPDDIEQAAEIIVDGMGMFLTGNVRRAATAITSTQSVIPDEFVDDPTSKGMTLHGQDAYVEYLGDTSLSQATTWVMTTPAMITEPVDYSPASPMLEPVQIQDVDTIGQGVGGSTYNIMCIPNICEPFNSGGSPDSLGGNITNSLERFFDKYYEPIFLAALVASIIDNISIEMLEASG